MCLLYLDKVRKFQVCLYYQIPNNSQLHPFLDLGTFLTGKQNGKTRISLQCHIYDSDLRVPTWKTLPIVRTKKNFLYAIKFMSFQPLQLHCLIISIVSLQSCHYFEFPNFPACLHRWLICHNNWTEDIVIPNDVFLRTFVLFWTIFEWPLYAIP